MILKDWANIVANISQVLLVPLGAMVFVQLKQSKDELKVTSKRQAATASSELAERFRKEILPPMNDYYARLRDKKFDIAQIDLENLKISSFYYEELTSLKAEHQKFNEELMGFFKSNRDLFDESINLLNSLESFAMNFTKGIADPQAIFSATGKTYCNFIERSFPVLCMLRHKDQFNFYENVVELYGEWSNQISLSGLELKQNSLSEEINKIKVGSRIIPPIGTK